jgi:DNA-binding NtrC family response regulator
MTHISPCRGRVLVVDDRLDWRKTLSGLLSDEGYDLRLASTLPDALHIARAEHLDAAVLDVRLDEADETNREGLSLMWQLREIDPAMVIVIVTGHADVTMLQEALQPDSQGISPAYSVLHKAEIDRLPECLERAIGRFLRHAEPAHFGLLAQGEGQELESESDCLGERLSDLNE